MMAEPTGHNWQSTLAMPEFEEEIKYLINYTKGTIFSEDEWPGDDPELGEVPFNDLTIGMNEAGEWSFQTGDNSFTGGAYHYPHWAVVSIEADSDPDVVFEDICNQLADLMER
jgi:hypothetical protein